MTGIHMALLSSARSFPASLNCSASNSAAGLGTSTASVNFTSDGGMGGSASYFGPSGWFIPLTTGIGSSYWISINGGAWTSLSSTVTTSLTGGNASSNRSVSIASDASGANIVATGTISLSVTNGGA